jgi:hypothetical protein
VGEKYQDVYYEVVSDRKKDIGGKLKHIKKQGINAWQVFFLQSGPRAEAG